MKKKNNKTQKDMNHIKKMVIALPAIYIKSGKIIGYIKNNK